MARAYGVKQIPQARCDGAGGFGQDRSAEREKCGGQRRGGGTRAAEAADGGALTRAAAVQRQVAGARPQEQLSQIQQGVALRRARELVTRQGQLRRLLVENVQASSLVIRLFCILTAARSVWSDSRPPWLEKREWQNGAQASPLWKCVCECVLLFVCVQPSVAAAPGTDAVA